METYKDVLLISEKTLKDNSLIDANMSYAYVQPVLKKVQDKRLSTILGIEMYDDIRKQVYDDAISGDTKYLLDNYIKYILIWGVASELQVPLFAKFRNMGMVNTGDDRANNISLQDIKYTKNQYEMDANFYEVLMAEYICDNSSKYSLYCPTKKNSNENPICL